jgi:hypothetical protein
MPYVANPGEKQPSGSTKVLSVSTVFGTPTGMCLTPLGSNCKNKKRVHMLDLVERKGRTVLRCSSWFIVISGAKRDVLHACRAALREEDIELL